MPGDVVGVLLEPATAAKHRLYKNKHRLYKKKYLDAWWPILLQPSPIVVWERCQAH